MRDCGIEGKSEGKSEGKNGCHGLHQMRHGDPEVTRKSWRMNGDERDQGAASRGRLMKGWSVGIDTSAPKHRGGEARAEGSRVTTRHCTRRCRPTQSSRAQYGERPLRMPS